METHIDERVLVLMPTARDGERTARVLAEAGLACAVCDGLVQLCREIERGGGAALLTEEAVEGDREGRLRAALEAQPPWSDFPLVVLARQGAEDAPIREAMNATLVERPVKVRSLLSVVRAALRSRRRQYEVRDHLEERARHAEALRAGEERLRRMINVDGVGVLVFALPEGRLVGANDHFLRMSGYTRAEVEAGGLTWRALTPPEYVAVSEEQMAGFARTGRIGPYEKEYFRKDGSRAWMVFAGASLGDGTAVEYCIDVGDRKRAEEQLRDADRKKDDFIALLAHELRNPLAPIRNGLNVMRLAGADEEAVGETREIMGRQIAHMVRLIDDLLDVSRINRNKMDLRLARITLAEAVNSALETARPLIDAGGHSLSVTVPEGPIHLEADLTRLAQVFSNLLTNSAKYTRPGGKIRLIAERRGGEVAVSVRDDGIGIPPESLASIFDMFSQVDRGFERATGGLGIGLALVKGLVEMHGGTVAAESEGEGKGSTFIVTLPVAATPTTSAPTPQANGKPEVRRRILIVDDSRDGADTLARMLRLMGNDVRIANDGLEGVEAAADFLPEIVLMDVGMPVLNGLDATRRIREHEWGRDMAIIALTGWGQEGDKERSRQAGCDGHLVKPVEFADLEKLLGAGRV